MGRPASPTVEFERHVSAYGPQGYPLPEPEFSPVFGTITLRAALDGTNLCIGNGRDGIVPTGFALRIPDGYMGMVQSAPNLAERNILVKGGTDWLTPAHRQHLHVKLRSIADAAVYIQPGEPVATVRIFKRQGLNLAEYESEKTEAA